MKKILLLILILPVILQAADTELQDLVELTAIAGTDVLYVVDDPSGTPVSKKITAANIFDLINTYALLNAIMADLTLTHNGLFDTFSELNAIVADKTLVNEEDAATWDALGVFGLGITITTGDDFIIGTTQWNSADEIDGTKIKDADYGDIDVSAGGAWTLDTDVVDVDALDQTISPTLTGRWTFAGEDTGTDVIGLNVNWAGSDPTNGQSSGDFWYDSTLNLYKGYTTHEIILGSAEEPGIVQAKKGSAGTISAGDAVYITGFDGTDLLIELADADDSSKMPAIGIASATINSGTAGSVTTFGLLESILNTAGMSIGDGIWITATGTTGNTLTNTKPTGATTAIQRIATVVTSEASGELFVAGALRTNDESNLTEAYIFVGNSSQNSTAVAMSGDVAIIANGTTSVLWGNIAEGELANSTVISADIKDDTIDSADYAAGSIDYEHLADDVISGAAAVGTFGSGDTFLVLEAGVGLREADYDDLPGSSGGDSILINTTAITDGSGVDLTNGTGITITLNAGVSPDTATFAATLGTSISDGEVDDDITITNISQVADISASASEINTPLDGATVTLTEFQELQTIDATTISANQWSALGSLAETLSGTEINILDGVTGVTAAELSYIGDVTGLIQSQIDGKEGTLSDKASLESTISDVANFAEADGDTWTGTHDLSGATVTMPKRTKNDDRFYLFNAWNPNALYDTDTQLCIEPNLPADITITEVTITLDADPTTELDWDLKWADAFIGLGTATLIVAIDTTNGTADIDSGFSDATVVAGKCLYIEFAADPDSNIKQAIVKIRYDFD